MIIGIFLFCFPMVVEVFGVIYDPSFSILGSISIVFSGLLRIAKALTQLGMMYDATTSNRQTVRRFIERSLPSSDDSRNKNLHAASEGNVRREVPKAYVAMTQFGR
jgi:hypothetical protein